MLRPSRVVLLAALAAIAVFWGGRHALAQAAPTDDAAVRADHGCLHLMASPSLPGDVLNCLLDGTTVEVLDDEKTKTDGREWQLMSARSAEVGDSSVEAHEPPAVSILDVPVAGGLTIGAAGLGDPAAVAEAQPFKVVTISTFDPATQQWLVYIPGAPAVANSLGSDDLEADSIVIVRRAGDRPADLPAPPAATPAPTLGAPRVLTAPPPGGLTQGVSGTNDPALVAAVQPFPVTSVSMLDVASQSWLVFIPGAPTIVNTLHTGTLGTDVAVTVRRASLVGPPPEEPTAQPIEERSEPSAASTPAPSDVARTAQVPITYYYCSQGSSLASIGDGGGFCGFTASGEPVQAGGASCARGNLGQRFRIVGDPLRRVYTCIDTGGGVFGEHRDIWFANSDEGYSWRLAVGPSATIEILRD